MKKMLIPMLLVILLLLSACAESVPQPTVDEPEQLVFLTIDERVNDGIYGWDEQGMRWKVTGNYDDFWACTWVRYTGDPVSGKQFDYEVTATDAWYKKQSDKGFGGEVYDSIGYDCDDDGDEELCLITGTEFVSEGQFRLEVWEGDTLASDALIYTDGGSIDALAFDHVDGKLVIRAVDWPYGADSWTVDTFRISWQDGGPVVSKMTQ